VKSEQAAAMAPTLAPIKGRDQPDRGTGGRNGRK
jgi:hypothetical protein